MPKAAFAQLWHCIKADKRRYRLNYGVLLNVILAQRKKPITFVMGFALSI